MSTVFKAVDMANAHQPVVVKVPLTPIEYKLLAVLVRNAGRVVTHQQSVATSLAPERRPRTVASGDATRRSAIGRFRSGW